MKECMILNICSVTVGSIAIAVACKVTRSAWPLIALALIPKWNWSSNESQK